MCVRFKVETIIVCKLWLCDFNFTTLVDLSLHNRLLLLYNWSSNFHRYHRSVHFRFFGHNLIPLSTVAPYSFNLLHCQIVIIFPCKSFLLFISRELLSRLLPLPNKLILIDHWLNRFSFLVLAVALKVKSQTFVVIQILILCPEHTALLVPFLLLSQFHLSLRSTLLLLLGTLLLFPQFNFFLLS